MYILAKISQLMINQIKQNESKLIDIAGVGIINRVFGDMSTALSQVIKIDTTLVIYLFELMAVIVFVQYFRQDFDVFNE